MTSRDNSCNGYHFRLSNCPLACRPGVRRTINGLAHLVAVSSAVGILFGAIAAKAGPTESHSATTLVAAASPAIRVTLSQPIYHIRVDQHTGAPVMPRDVVAFAEAVNLVPGSPAPTSFRWRVMLDWNAGPYPTRHSIANQLFVQAPPFVVNLDQEVRGGTLTVFAKATIDGKDVFGKAEGLVVGDNPPRDVVLRSFPPNRLGLIASKIGMAESGLHQFTESKGAGIGGMPVVSKSNDVGLMQLNAPTGSISSADEVWDWRANLARGLRILEGKRQNTALASRRAVGRSRVPDTGLEPGYTAWSVINAWREELGLSPLQEPIIPPFSEVPGSGMLPDEPDPDHLALSQMERDAIRRYNGGHEFVFQVVPDPLTLDILWSGWAVDPGRGGIRSNSGDPNYILHVLQARSGFRLPEPPKAAKQHGATHRRRRSRK